MALDEEELEKFEQILTDAMAGKRHLSEWERGFIDDFHAKHDEYGDNIRISAKQWEILERIRDKL